MDKMYHPETSELLFLRASFTLARKLVQLCVIPLVQYVHRTAFSTLTRSKFVENKNTIANHVTQVFGKVKIFLSADNSSCNKIIEQVMLAKTQFIGLDCEWESSKKNGVALIQISTGNSCLLHRVALDSKIPENLRLLLENHSVLKFGVAIQEDVKRLKFHGVHVRGFVDLRNLAQRCLPPLRGNVALTDEENMGGWTSLHKLSLHALNIKLDKGYHTRCSDWEAPTLSQTQILYAAKDAIVSLEIFYALILLRKVNRQSTSVLVDSFTKTVCDEAVETATPLDVNCCGYYDHMTDCLISSDGMKIDAYTPTKWLVSLAQSLCQGIVDSSHKVKPGNRQRNRSSTSKPNMDTKKPCKLKEYRHQCRDKPLYENCVLLGPDDQILATVNRSKASWYIHKNLGEVTCEEPYTVKLFFEPSGRPMPDADYYTTVKDNVCVVCEGTDSFVRKMVIPHDYRKYFPLELKDHMSHDVLLMCLSCHRFAQHWDEQLRQRLAAECNAPLGTADQRLFLDHPQISKVRSAAKALHFSGLKIPEGRRNELLSVIQKYCGAGEDITDEKIRELADLDTKVKNENYGGPHGKRVVDTFVAENRLAEFIKMWRQHFLDNMKPKHLPPMWSVEHNLDKLRAKQATRV